MDPQTTTVSPEIPDSSPQIPKDSHWITILAMALFVLLSLAAVAFLYYQNQQLKTMLASYQASPTPSATPDVTANWKTYTSAKANYSLKYPDSWPVVQIPVSAGCETCIENIHFSPSYNPQSADSDLAIVLVFKDSRIKTLDDYKNIIIKGDSSIVNVLDTVVGTEKAVSYKLSGGIPPLPIIEYIVVKNNFYYVIRLVDSKETNKNLTQNQTTFDQILSTFRFLQ